MRRSRGAQWLFILGLAALLIVTSGGVVYAMPPVQRMVLTNRLVVLLCEEHTLPFATIQLLVDAGSRRDPAGKEGVARLVAKGLLLGTSKRTATSIDEQLDFMGASLSSSSGKDYATVSLKVLKKDLAEGLDLFLDALQDPTFPDGEVHREVEKALAAIQSQEDRPGEVAAKAFAETLFKDPYGHPVEGTRESLSRITRESLIEFYRSYYHPSNAILAIVGDVTAAEAEKMLLPRLRGWSTVEIPHEQFVSSFAEGFKTVMIDRPITQANIIIGQEGVSRENPDYYALSVMNYILGGGGFGSRLMEEIRNRRGFAYSVGSYFDPGKYPGSFQISLETKNATAREAISLAIEQMKRMQTDLVSEDELEVSKKYLIGSFPMRFDTQSKLCNFVIQMEYFRLGSDYPDVYPSLIRSITREEVLRVAKAYLHPERHVLVVVGDLKEAGMEEGSPAPGER